MMQTAIETVRFFSIRLFLIIVCLGAMQPGRESQAAMFELLPEPDGVRGPWDPLRIAAGSLAGAGSERRAVELDDVDVTALLAVEGEVLVLRPVEPLAWGEHRLRLVEYTDEGEIIERGFWTFEVRHSAALREADGTVAAAWSASRRLADDGLSGAPGAFQSEGVAQVRGQLADGGWRVDGEADLLYNPRRELRPEGMAPLDAGAFRLRARRGGWEALAGQQMPLAESLIARDFLRRGASVAYLHGRSGLSLQGFASQAQETVGFNKGLGLDEAGNRLQGLVLSLRPSRQSLGSGDLAVSAAWFTGRDPGQVGVGVGGDTATAADNTAYSVVVDGRWLDRRLRLRGEAARTRYDYDGAGEAPAVRDDALALLAVYDYPAVRAGLPAWQVGVERRRLGTYFRSIADPGGVADRDAWRGFLALQWDGIELEASLGRERDNVNELIGLPRIATRQAALALAWSLPVGEESPWQPGLEVAFSDLRQRVARAGGGLEQGGLRDTRTWQLGANLAAERTTLGLSFGHGRDEDLLYGGGSDSATREFNMETWVGEDLFLAVAAQQERYRGLAGGGRSLSETWTLDGDYRLTPRLALRASLAGSRERDDEGTQASRRRSLVLSLRWQMWRAGVRRPASYWTLEGSRDRLRDAAWPEGNADFYQLFLRFEMAWQQE